MLHWAYDSRAMLRPNDERQSRPIRIGISSCLLGEGVRFDGGHKRDAFLTDTFGRFVEWVPVCPEVECGLGTPRESMRLVSALDGHDVRLLTGKTRVDHTDRMARYSRRRVDELASEDLCGYVLKKDSPSCGLERVKIYGAHGVPDEVRTRNLRRQARRALPAPAGGGRRSPVRPEAARKLRRAGVRVLEASRPLRRAMECRDARAFSYRAQAHPDGALPAGVSAARTPGGSRANGRRVRRSSATTPRAS